MQGLRSVMGCGRGRWGFCEQQAHIPSRYYLHERAALDMSNFNEVGFEGQDVWVVQS